jgi:hypothetical protein
MLFHCPHPEVLPCGEVQIGGRHRAALLEGGEFITVRPFLATRSELDRRAVYDCQEVHRRPVRVVIARQGNGPA